MHAYGRWFVLIAGIAYFGACEDSIGPTDTPTSLELSAKPPSNTLYTYALSGDIEGTLTNVSASTSDPFKQVNTGGLSFEFPATSTADTTACNQKDRSLAPTVNDWGGYDSGPWAGEMNLSRRKRSSFHLQITGTQTDGAGSINLAVNDVPVEGTNDEGNPELQFQDSRALISALSYSDTTSSGEPDYDADDRCVNFTITATPQ
jgi:hypothetical protein